MGQEIEKEDFSDADYLKFSAQLQGDLAALQLVLERPHFGAGETTIGAELELNLIDAAAQPLPQNREILASISDPRVKLELDRFNLELNCRPLPLAGRAAGRHGAHGAHRPVAVVDHPAQPDADAGRGPRSQPRPADGSLSEEARRARATRCRRR